MIIDFTMLILFIVCVALSAFFSSAEVALIGITKAKVRTLHNEGKKGSKALSTLKESPDRILITILIGNNIATIGATAIATSIAISAFGDIGIGISTGIVIIILLMFGEIGPKLYATRSGESYTLFIAPIILFLSQIISPLIYLVEWAGKRKGNKNVLTEPSVTEDEIKEWIEVGKEEGTIEQEEREMLYSVLQFGDTNVRQVMIPRIDVSVIEDNCSLEKAMKIFSETGYSRLPVYHDTIDNIVGVLNVKDVFSILINQKHEVRIRDLVYEPYFVPESKMIDDLLKELQVRKMQLAIVLDEYSSFAGIITVEDILEELVGDILDEFDIEENSVEKGNNGEFIVNSQVWVQEMNEEYGFSLPIHDSYETIGGLVFSHLGHIPHPGESIILDESGVTIVVMQMRGRRIIKIKIIPKESPVLDE